MLVAPQELAASPEAIRIAPMPYTTPEVPSFDFAGRQRRTSAPTVAASAAAAVIYNWRAELGLSTTIAVTGEEYSDGTNTGDIVAEDLVERGVPESDVESLGPAGSTYGQLCALGDADILAHKSHIDRLEEVKKNVGVNSGVVAVSSVLETAQAKEFMDPRELLELLSKSNLFDKKNGPYEQASSIRAFTALTKMPGGLWLATRASRTAQRVFGMNSVDVTSDGLYVQGRRR